MKVSMSQLVLAGLVYVMSTWVWAETDAPSNGPDRTPCFYDCGDVPDVPNVFWTTAFGPARADILLQKSNFLACSGGAYALCYYSGPVAHPGGNPDLSPLPCVLDKDDSRYADCTCVEIPSGAYYVDINGILNTQVYMETVNKCGRDGAGCSTENSAPVCQYITNQSSGDQPTLRPKADLISTFSYALEKIPAFRIGQTSCATDLYAGCMTAACFRTDQPGKIGQYDTVQCRCPTYNGPFQVGQSGASCNLAPGHIWSAAYNPCDSGTHPKAKFIGCEKIEQAIE